MRLKIKHPGTQNLHLLSAIGLPFLLFLIFCFIMIGGPFAWVPRDACSSFLVKFFLCLFLFICLRPLYCYFKYRRWAHLSKTRIAKAIDFMPSHMVVHYEDGTERFDYQALRLKLILRITHISFGPNATCIPRITLITLRFHDAVDGLSIFEIDHAVDYRAYAPKYLLKSPFSPGTETKDLDAILAFASRFHDFAYAFTYDCKPAGLVSDAPNAIFSSEFPSEEAKMFERTLSDKMEEAVPRNKRPN